MPQLSKNKEIETQKQTRTTGKIPRTIPDSMRSQPQTQSTQKDIAEVTAETVRNAHPKEREKILDKRTRWLLEQRQRDKAESLYIHKKKYTFRNKEYLKQQRLTPWERNRKCRECSKKFKAKRRDNIFCKRLCCQTYYNKKYRKTR